MTERMNEIAGAYNSIYNGLTMCVGSYASSRENDVISMVDEFASKINFVHLRNVEKEEERGSFVESDHLGGDVDMYEVGGRAGSRIFSMLYADRFVNKPVTGRSDIYRLATRPIDACVN